MLRFLLDKFKQAPGPFKQARLVTGDLAEEMLDLSDYYLKRIRTRIHGGFIVNESQKSTVVLPRERDDSIAHAGKIATKMPGAPESQERQLEVSPELGKALDVAQFRKKQEFKVLAILYDANSRGLGQLSAKEVSEHGLKLGLAIRHENVRKVIRMRLDQKIDVQTVVAGNGSIYKYSISKVGIDYFKSKYLTN